MPKLSALPVTIGPPTRRHVHYRQGRARGCALGNNGRATARASSFDTSAATVPGAGRRPRHPWRVVHAQCRCQWASAEPARSPRQRLVTATRSNSLGTVSTSYAANGNLLAKSDYANAYSYTGIGPHAVKQATALNGTALSYQYDQNGNLTGGNTLTANYDHDNKPWFVSRSSNGVFQGSDQFLYGADGERFYHQDNTGRVIHYGAGGYERIQKAGQTEHRHHLPGLIVGFKSGSGLLASGITKVFTYRHQDRLGSTVALSDSQGKITERRSFDAFGQTRNGDFSNKQNGTLAFTGPETRGFTEHEHLDQTYLIHMNGRTYDYRLGRFLAVDPFIQFPTNSQSLNPYSYILNNPLAGTDPTGYAACGEVIADGDVCQVTVSVAVKEDNSRITKTVTQTFTVANNGGNILLTPGGDRAAFDRIEAAIVGSVSERSSGPTVGATPMKVRSDGRRFGGAVQSLQDPNKPNPILAAIGEVKGAFSEPDSDGFRTNPVTGEDVKNPQETRENTLFGLMTLAIPGAPELKAVGAGKSLEFGHNSRKLDFLFNRNIDPSVPGNVVRATGNAQRIGIADTSANRTEVVRLFNRAFSDPRSIVGPGTKPGSTVREFFLPGVTGTGSRVQFVEQGGRVITIIAK